MVSRISKLLALRASLCAIGIIFGYVEFLVPIPIGVPGIKLGLANLIVVIALFMLDAPSAFLINLVRIIVSSLLFSSVSAAIYSLFGMLFSFIIMLIAKKINLNIVLVSAFGGIFHNIGQVIAASIFLSDAKILNLIMVLFIVGLITGTLIGLLSKEILKIVSKKK